MISGKSISVSALLLLLTTSARADGFMDLTLPDLGNNPETPQYSFCENRPPEPDWISKLDRNEIWRARLARDIYALEGFRNVVEDDECSCERRYPSWDAVTDLFDGKLGTMRRPETFEITHSLYQERVRMRDRARPICERDGHW